MKITNIVANIVPLELKSPIKVAFGTIAFLDTVFIRVEFDNGIIGFGESSPIAFVTGNTAQTVPIMLEYLKPFLIDAEINEPADIHKILDKATAGNTALKAGLDIAIYDGLAKSHNISLAEYMGAKMPTVTTDTTLSIDDVATTLKHAQTNFDKGFKALKVKTGIDWREDIDRISALRDHFGSDLEIRIDANQGMSVAESIEFCNGIEPYNVRFVEQPIAASDILGLKEIKENVNVPIMADESLFSPADAKLLLELQAVDLLNIKLMKCGGVFKGKQIADLAQKYNVNCMIGCMLETQIGLGAAATLAASHDNITMIDLDSLLYQKPGAVNGGMQYDSNDQSQIILSSDLGLGATPDIYGDFPITF